MLGSLWSLKREWYPLYAGSGTLPCAGAVAFGPALGAAVGAATGACYWLVRRRQPGVSLERRPTLQTPVRIAGNSVELLKRLSHNQS